MTLGYETKERFAYTDNIQTQTIFSIRSGILCFKDSKTLFLIDDRRRASPSVY